MSAAISLKTMQLNDQKAGMQGVDKEAINKIIYEASAGTPYFAAQEKKQKRIDDKVKEMLEELSNISDVQKNESLKKMDALCLSLEKERNLSCTLVHIDMDAFYAAVEMRDNPQLASKPMAVGSMSMLATSNYEARKYGIRAAMPGFIAKKLCPDVMIVPPNFDQYKKVSKQVMKIVEEYDPNYSAASLDEVYFDLTNYISKKCGNKPTNECQVDSDTLQISDDSSSDEISDTNASYDRSISASDRDRCAWVIVEEIRGRIFKETGLTASAGIAPNTMLSKVCSDQNKPNGQYQIHSDIEEVREFIKNLPVRKVSGIGPVQVQHLNGLGIFTCADLYAKRDIVNLLFSEISVHFYMRVALGLGSTTVHNDYIRKSIGVEVTFKDTHVPEELHKKCEDLCQEVVDDLKSHHLVGKVVVLKIKTVNFQVHTRNSTLPQYSSDADIILNAAKKLLNNEIKVAAPSPLKLRLMGIRMANLINEHDVKEEKQVKLKDFLQNKQTTTAQSSYHCPICNLEVNTNLQLFNEHVDHCLGDQSKPETSIAGQKDLTKRPLECPVCGKMQESDKLLDLNVHIDSCLSKVAIKDLLNKDTKSSGSSEKRKLNSIGSKGKKMKLEIKVANTIDSYFKS